MLTYFLKVIDLQSKPCTCTCLLQLVGIIFSRTSFNSVTLFFSNSVAPGKKSKYSLISINQSAYRLTFKPRSFLVLRNIAWFFLNRLSTGEMYESNHKMIVSTVIGFVPSTSSNNESNWRNASPCDIVWRYWFFPPVTSVPDAARAVLKFCTNNKNSSGSPLWKKSVLNS